MNWRKPTLEDIKRGIVVRRTSEHARAVTGKAADPFDDAVVIRVEGSCVDLARPMAYAHEAFDSKQPLLMAEVYSVYKDTLVEHYLMYVRGSGDASTPVTFST